MSIRGINIKENPLYVSYDDECWVLLAKEIMRSYSRKYSYQIPTTATSQLEYDELDRRTYLPIRKSIIRNVMQGPLKNVVDIPSIYRAFEEQRISYKESLGILWKDREYDNIYDI